MFSRNSKNDYTISDSVITIPFVDPRSDYGNYLKIDITSLMNNNDNYNKTFIKDYFDFIKEFPNEQYLTNISLFSWWAEHKINLKYKILNKLNKVTFPNLLNKKKGVLGRKEEYKSIKETLPPEIDPPYGWVWRKSSGYGGNHYYLDTLNIEKDFEIKSQFFLIKFEKDNKEHSMYLPFPRGLFSSDKSIYYTVDNFNFIKEMYEKDWDSIEHTVKDIEEYLNKTDKTDKKENKWKDNFKYLLKWKRYMFIMLEKLSNKSYENIRGTVGGRNGHQHYDLFRTKREYKGEKVLKDKLDKKMKETYLNNLVEQMDQGKIKCTDKQICTEKLKEFCVSFTKFIQVLDSSLQGTEAWKNIRKQKFRIKSMEIKNIYFENVKDFIYQTDLTGKVVKIGEVQVPCILYPRPLKPPSLWNNTWIRCSFNESEQSRKQPPHIIKGRVNNYRDTYDAWYLKEEYMDNLIVFYNLEQIDDFQNFKNLLEERREIDLNIEGMYLDFKDISESKEDEVETIVVNKKEHKLVTKQRKLVTEIEDELKSISSLIKKYNNIKDVIKEIPVLNGKKMTVDEYNKELGKLSRMKGIYGNQNRINDKTFISLRTEKSKEQLDLLILFLLWGNIKFNQDKYFRDTKEGKINSYGYKEIYDTTNGVVSTKSKNKIKKLPKIEIGKTWYEFYQKIENFDLSKRTDIQNNNELRKIIGFFTQNKDLEVFEKINKDFFRLLKKEAHIYLDMDTQNKIKNYIKYLNNHNYILLSDYKFESQKLNNLENMNPRELDNVAKSLTINRSKKKKNNKKEPPQITAEQEIKLDIIYKKYQKEQKYLSNKWKEFIEDATSSQRDRQRKLKRINDEIIKLKEKIQENQNNFIIDNLMSTREYNTLKEQIRKQKEKCDKLQQTIKDTNNRYLIIICEEQVRRLKDKIKTTFAQYIEENISKPKRLVKQREEISSWLNLLVNPNPDNIREFQKIYRKQYNRLRNLYLSIQRIGSKLVILERDPEEKKTLNKEIEDFQTKYNKFQEKIYFT